jgi:RimJ/RimL family protein N-acetyltransferase
MDLSKTVIETSRLLLVPPSLEYKEDIFREFQEPVTFFMYPKPATEIEETEKFIKDSNEKRLAGTDLTVMIIKKDTHEFLGCGGLHKTNTTTPELGIWIKQSAHGNKYGLETMQALKDWADKNLNYTHITYPVAEQNIPSRKIAESLGGKVQKELDKLMLTGRIHHMVEYWIPKK